MSTSLHRQFGLDLARSLAITLVVISHLARPLDPLGIWGVELFFALSGYLIGGILWRIFSNTEPFTGRQLVNFWLRRWWRTLPNYYLFFIVFLVWYQLLQRQAPSMDSLLKPIWFGQYLWIGSGSWYGISWSLCVEEWFYLSFPILLFLYAKLVRGPHIPFLLAILTVLIGSFVVRLYLTSFVKSSDLRFITPGRLDAIGYGVLVAYLMATLTLSRQRIWLLFFGGTLLILSPFYPLLFGGRDIAVNPATLLLLPLGFAFSLPMLATMNRPQGRYLAIAVERISVWSYSIYLSHIPILFFVYALMNEWRSNPILNGLSKLVGVLLCVIASAAIYRFFERPLTQKRPNELLTAAPASVNTSNPI